MFELAVNPSMKNIAGLLKQATGIILLIGLARTLRWMIAFDLTCKFHHYFDRFMHYIIKNANRNLVADS